MHPNELRKTTLRNQANVVIDRGMAVHFPAPRTFTGEDVVEFHLHGGKAVVAAMLSALSALPDFRHAEPGEFTRRAFLNGKLDLTGAEALSDLIAAETEAQRQFAITNAAGAQRALYDGWRRRLIHARAMIEAELDFADEADVPGSVAAIVWKDMADLAIDIDKHARSYCQAEMIRDGYRVVIIGAPNAGKSSLLNALVRRDAAIVSDEPGTTRDLIDVSMDLGGYKVVITDTAGIRAAPVGTVEAIGIERAIEGARRADLVIHLFDAVVGPDSGADIGQATRLMVANKIDISSKASDISTADFRISAQTGAGLNALLGDIQKRAADAASPADTVLPSRLRHVHLLELAQVHLCRGVYDVSVPLELRAEELRIASIELGRIVGSVDVEDLLDGIFSTFCIGK